MPAALTPRRRSGREVLDDPTCPVALRERSHRDIVRSNALFGGTRALLTALDECLPTLPRQATLLDVGAGTGEACHALSRHCDARGITSTTVALDLDEALVAAARPHADLLVCGSALQLPLADRSVDVATCALVAHHFEHAALTLLLRELDRVARRAVIVSDLRRSWLAAAGIWLTSFPLGFHPVSRHDGVLSVLRGFTVAELDAAVYQSCGVHPVIRRRLGYRVTATWAPSPAARPRLPSAAEPACVNHSR